jgi:hypothetical protein
MCSSDADCGQYSCDFTTHQCLVPSLVQENEYVACIVENVSKGTLSLLKTQLSLSSDATNVQVSAALREVTLTKDCVEDSGLAFPYRTFYQLLYQQCGDVDYMGYYGQGVVMCADYTCDVGPSMYGTAQSCGSRREWVHRNPLFFIPRNTKSFLLDRIYGVK